MGGVREKEIGVLKLRAFLLGQFAVGVGAPLSPASKRMEWPVDLPTRRKSSQLRMFWRAPPEHVHGFSSAAPRLGVLDRRLVPRVPSTDRLCEGPSVLSPHPTPSEPQIRLQPEVTSTPSLL